MPEHPFAPVFDAHSRVLVLGSFPSVKSRENGFYYGHPQNRFWRMLAGVYGVAPPVSIEEKTALLLSRRIALWDAAAACEIEGSMDRDMRCVRLNDLGRVLDAADIGLVLANGRLAGELYGRYQGLNKPPVRVLPSTSPANAAWSLKQLCIKWAESLPDS